MKKGIVVLFIIMLVVMLTKNHNEAVLIPKDAIRFRILANSNSLEDQQQKLTIKKELEPELIKITKNAADLDSARMLIKTNISSLNDIISNYTSDYSINYGSNYFPEKTYKGVTYQEGNYESVVVTLGDGLGDNWWCVLFPPLCLLEASSEEIDDVTYAFYIEDIINKF